MENPLSGYKIVKLLSPVFILSALLSVPKSPVSAQAYDILQPLEGYKSNIYFSKGNDKRAMIIAERMDRVYLYFKEKIFFEPDVTLLILNPQDWGQFTTFPVYGMPHYDEKRELLIMASDNNDFWNSFIPEIDKLPKDLANKIFATYIDENDKLTMQAFFDLLAIHEMGHAYHFQAGLNMQRKWIGELFCNILLHTYIAENEPEQLPALTVFPQMVIRSGKDGFKYTSLRDLEEFYEEIGQNHARNYGWYQSRWHEGAGQIYDSAGSEAFKNLWSALLNQKEVLDDNGLVLFLSNVHQSLGDIVLKWDE